MNKPRFFRLLAVVGGGGLGWLYSYWQTCSGST